MLLGPLSYGEFSRTERFDRMYANLGHCGKMKIATTEFEDEDSDDDMRIVGGFDAPEPVPWFVMLKINTQNGSFNGHQCGATLITTRVRK